MAAKKPAAKKPAAKKPAAKPAAPSAAESSEPIVAAADGSAVVDPRTHRFVKPELTDSSLPARKVRGA